MCRLAAFPPRFDREEALSILDNMVYQNTDGTGSVHVKDGKFIVKKWPDSFNKIIKSKIPFLSHMPHDGWTLAHLRAASHGNNCMENTHPFISGDWAVAHNGIWSEYNIVKLALKDSISFKGDTDSEVAASLINLVGPSLFSKEVGNFSGVFLCLNKNGSLCVIKSSGDLEVKVLSNGKVLLASELKFPKYSQKVEALCGYYKFNKDGKYKKHFNTGVVTFTKSSYKPKIYSYPMITDGYGYAEPFPKKYSYQKSPAMITDDHDYI